MRTRSMGTRLTGVLAAATVGVTACGGGGNGSQDEVADMFIELAESEGIELDRDCVVKTAGELSDADAENIVEAGANGSADVSDDAQAIGIEILSCLDVDSFRDSVLTQFEQEGSIDIDCLRAELEQLETVEEIEDRVIDAAFGCAG